MRKIIEADMRRVMAKFLPWVLIVITYAMMYLLLLADIDSAPDRNFFFLTHVSQSYATVALAIGFAILFGVYGDEFKSMVMIGVIGRGYSRDKFVLAKFMDAVIYEIIMVAISVGYIMILKNIFNITLHGAEIKYFICMFVFEFLMHISYITIASIFYFASENAAVGVFSYLAFELIIPVTLEVIKFFSSTFAKYKVDMYYVEGLGASAYSDLVLGDNLGAIMKILLLIAVYTVGALFVTMLIFRKKELEF